MDTDGTNITVEPLPLEVPTLDNGDGSVMVCVKPDAELRVCGAQLRGKPGEFCQKRPSSGRSRCALHGGKSPRGEQSPHFKSGMYSKALPKNLRADFEKLSKDPELLEARSEVALLQMRVRQLTARLNSNESGEGWKRLRAVFAEFRAANAASDEPGQLAALARLDEIINGEIDDEDAWTELTEFIDKATRVAERESKRLIATRNVATAEQVRALVAAVTNVVLTNVQDQPTRLRIANDIDRLRVIEPLTVAGDGSTE